MKIVHTKLALTTIVVSLFLPAIAFANSVVSEPASGAKIIDSGDVGCYVSISNTSVRYGDVFYEYQASIFCKNTFSNTSVQINKIEISSGASNPTVRVVVKGFPIATDNFNPSETKTYSISTLIPPNSPNNKSVEYYFMHGLAQPTKIYLDVLGQEKVMYFDTPLSTLKFELLPSVTFKLYVIDETSPITKTLNPQDSCIENHGLNSIVGGNGDCTCKENYMFNKTQQCMSAGDVCVSEYGKGGIPYTVNSCACANGFHLDGRSCIADAKPVRYISASVKKWADDNYAFNTPCDSNKSFTADEIKVCTDYNTTLYRDKYDWQIITPPPISPTPIITPVSPPVVVSKTLVPVLVPKPPATTTKPKLSETIRPIELKSTTTATTTDIQEASTTIEFTLPVVEEVKIQPPQPPTPPPAPISFWSKVISWFKFW